jgi:predicted transcriptional regulator with HTH domain
MSLLFNTKLRKKMLTYSFTHPDKEYYVRELASIIHEDAGNLSRELRKLEGEGLYRSFSKGGLKFYSLNKNYSLFNEVKKIIFKTKGVEGGFKNLISR